MQFWRLDPNNPEHRQAAVLWMEYLEEHRYYSQTVFLPYTIRGQRGILCKTHWHCNVVSIRVKFPTESPQKISHTLVRIAHDFIRDSVEW